jgi:hypothetical protein
MTQIFQDIARKMCALLATWLLLVLHAQASLEWEKKEIKLEVHPTQLSETAVFHFTNTGNAAVTIDDIKPGCGCLIPKKTKRSIAPDESGNLEIVFNLSGRAGRQRKATAVKTSDGKQANLSVSVDIPESYTIKPLLLKWEKDNETKTMSVKLVNKNKAPIILTSVKSSDKDLSAELKPIREGFEYEVEIRRLGFDRRIRGVMTVASEPPPGETVSKPLQFYVLVP